MTIAWCLYISCVHDSTLLWDLIDAPTTSYHVLSVCAISFTEIDHDAIRNVISVQYVTPWPWNVLIAWSLNHVISHPSLLVILVLHIHIFITIQVPYQTLEPVTRNTHIYPSLPYRFSSIIPSIISSSFSPSSLHWFYFQNLEGKPGII
jgi:hypothetical protein